MTTTAMTLWPWTQTLREALRIKPQLMIAGDVHDFRMLGAEDSLPRRELSELIADLLCTQGVEGIAILDPHHGPKPWVRPGAGADITAWNTRCTQLIQACIDAAPAEARRADAQAVAQLIQQIVDGGVADDGAACVASPPALALIIVDADKFAGEITRPQGPPADLFDFAIQIARRTGTLRSSSASTAPAYNPIIWLASFDRPLLKDQQSFAQIFEAHPELIAVRRVPRPTNAERNLCVQQLLPHCPAGQKPLQAQLEGETLRTMEDVVRLATELELPLDSPDTTAEVVRRYRFGVQQSPWMSSVVHAKVTTLEQTLPQAVLGQDHACYAVIQRIKRAVVGLSGAHRGAYAKGPRAVMWLAGPTGVGKTELVRHVATQLFGSVDACIRFDMSEFRAEHADQRLMGAPPGYTGHDSGGELTNAVRARPFSVLLLDEIDKAHDRIFDKFLQILEDGRLTDGHGVTTDFSQCVIFFTTNAGMARASRDPATGLETRAPTVTPDMPAAKMREAVAIEIRRLFRERIGRPEVLNRIGENIIVFNFITPEVGRKILGNLHDEVLKTLQTVHQPGFVLTASAQQALSDYALHPGALAEFGGRGIGNRLESTLINDLSEWLWDARNQASCSIRIDLKSVTDGIPQFCCLEATS